MKTTRELVIEYLQAVAAGATEEALGRYLHNEAVHLEMPNRMAPEGHRSDRAAMLVAARRGQERVRSQRYTVVSACAEGDRAALEIDWSGTLAAPIGSLPAGHVLEARVAIFVELRDGLIWKQTTYDCYR